MKMRHPARRAGAFALALALTWALAACGGQPAADLQIVEDPEAAPLYLRFFSLDGLSGSDLGKYWSDRFTQMYDKTVYVDYDGASYYAEEGLSYREMLEKRLQGSMPDDLYIINAEDVLDFEKKGYWMDLSGLDFVDHLSDAARYQSTYDGKVFSVPLVFTGFGFYWNVDLLAEHGLAVPENREEFWTACETLKQGGVLPYGANKGYALTVPAMCGGLSALYQSADRDRHIAGLNSGSEAMSTYMRDGFGLLQTLIDRGYMDPEQALSTVPNEEWDLFLEGKCGFICISLGAALKEPEKNDFQVALTGLPVLEEGSVAVYGADNRLCVNPKSEHLETALEFIEMVGAPQSLNASAELSDVMSSARDSRQEAPPSVQGLWQLLQSPGQIPNQDFALHFNTWESIRNVSRELCGGATVDEACQMLDDLQQAELEAYALGGGQQ